MARAFFALFIRITANIIITINFVVKLNASASQQLCKTMRKDEHIYL